MFEVILKRFEQPDEVRKFEKGKFELIHIGGMTIGRASYEPGWKWSVHVGKASGRKSCAVEHVGMVISGRATAAMDDGRVIEMKAGDVFYIAPGHDSWVVGTSRTSPCTFSAQKNTSRRNEQRYKLRA
ncbi:MAG TPA: cupin domain-containing protein [Candidatus Acidoferrales bacterium]|nr:cupin domain-containing protein [Candidatus Acidoferrales bacterium]